MNAAIIAAAKLETTVDRNLSILYYDSDRIEEAKMIAGNLLRKNSKDIIAQQILDDTYIPFNNEENIISDINDEYINFEGTDDSIPKLLEWMLSDVNYEKCFYGRNILNNIDNAKSKYIGNENQAETDIEDTLKNLESRSYSEKSSVYLALAKIIKQIVESGIKNKYFTQKRVNLFLGSSLLLKADAAIQNGYQNRDCSRYYYFLSLRYLSRSEDTKRFFHAINMLYHSFFLSDNELADTILKKDLEEKLYVTPPEYQESVISVKELMTCTFDLDINYHRSRIGGEKIVRLIINEIFANVKLRKIFAEKMTVLSGNWQPDCKNPDEFFLVWKKAKEQYNKLLSDLQKNIGFAANSIKDPEKLKKNINNISVLQAKQFPGKTDMEYLNNILEVFNRFDKVNELVIIDDLLNALEEATDFCETLEKEICTSPTNFSYECMLDIVRMLKGKAVEQKNNIYNESKPNLSVYQKDTAFYKDDYNRAKVTIYIENKGNVQKADIRNIILVGVDNNIEITGNPEHTITTVRGNGKDEYTVEISFTEDEKEREVFDVIFSFEYSYFDLNGDQVESKYSETYQINLSSIKSFKKIENKYSAFVNGGAVESDDMFFGRENEINRIVDSLDRGNGNVLANRGIYMYGQTRAGKSSIMAHLANCINDRYPDKYIIIDVGSLESCESKKYDIFLKTKIISKLEGELDYNYPDVYDKIESALSFDDIINRIEHLPDGNDFDRLLDKIERLLPNKVIMIFVDEFTYIYESIKKKQCYDTFPHFWKALLQNHRICSIIIGQDSMVNFAEEYVNDFACMQKMFVSYLDEDGAKKLINDPIKDDDQNRFEEEALDLIYELTAGSAYLIMIICSQLVDYMNDRGISRVTKTTIEIFVRKWLLNTASNSNAVADDVFDPQLNDPCFFENSDQIRSDNKTILAYISNNCNYNNQIKINDINCVSKLSKKNNEYQKELINQLIKRKVLIQEGEYCRIWIDLLRRYLETER